ncbi:hypothetical protein ACMFBJ_28100 [Escherichia coli]
MAETEVVPIDMPDSNGEMTWQAKNYTQYSSYFMKITIPPPPVTRFPVGQVAVAPGKRQPVACAVAI